MESITKENAWEALGQAAWLAEIYPELLEVVAEHATPEQMRRFEIGGRIGDDTDRATWMQPGVRRVRQPANALRQEGDPVSIGVARTAIRRIQQLQQS